MTDSTLKKRAAEVLKVSSHEVGIGCRWCKALVWKNSIIGKLISDQATRIDELEAQLKEMDELNPVTLVCKNDDGSTYEVRRFQFETEVNQIKEEMMAEGCFDNLPNPPKEKVDA